MDAARPDPLTAEEIARYFFDRPLDVPIDWDDLDEDWAWDDADLATRLEAFTDFFVRFPEIARPYSFEQVDRGLWAAQAVDGEINWVLEDIRYHQPSLAPRVIPFVRAMRHLFIDYLAVVEYEKELAFHMWWDCLASELGHLARDPRIDPDVRRDLSETHLAVLEEILGNEDEYCQVCALHGLGHLDHPRRPEVVQAFIDGLRTAGVLEGWDVEWIEECRDGTVM